MNAWVVKQFSVAKVVIEDKDIKAKAEFRGQREDNTLKADFQDFDLATFRKKYGLEWFIILDRALKF
jgi:hypothetical protein